MLFHERVHLQKICIDNICKNIGKIVNSGQNRSLYLEKILAEHIFERLSIENNNLNWLELFFYNLSTSLININIRIKNLDTYILEEFLLNAPLNKLNTICFKFENMDVYDLEMTSRYGELLTALVKHGKNIKKLGFEIHNQPNRQLVETMFKVFSNKRPSKKLQLEYFYYAYTPCIQQEHQDLLEYTDGRDVEFFRYFLHILDYNSIEIFRTSIHFTECRFVSYIYDLFKLKNLRILMLHGIYQNDFAINDNNHFVNLLEAFPHLIELDISIDHFSHLLYLFDGQQMLFNRGLEIMLNYIITNKDRLQLEVLDISGHNDIDGIVFRRILVEKTSLKVLRYLCTQRNFTELFTPDNFVVEFWEQYDIDSFSKYLMNYVHCDRMIFYILKNIPDSEHPPTNETFESLVTTLNWIFENIAYNTVIQEMAGKALIDLFCAYECCLTNYPLFDDVVQMIVKILKHLPFNNAVQKNGLSLLMMNDVYKSIFIDVASVLDIVFKYIRNNVCSTDDTTMVNAFKCLIKIVNHLQINNHPSLCASKNIAPIIHYIKMKCLHTQMSRSAELATLSLWNIIDQSHKASENFVALDGIDIIFRFAHRFINTPMCNKVVGVLSVIAEVPHLRKHLLKDEIIKWITQSITNKSIEKSFFAAETLVHLALEWKNHRSTLKCGLEATLRIVETCLKGWSEITEKSIIRYRSFDSMIPLLEEKEQPIVQYWAIFAIRYLCGAHGKHYFSFLCNCRLLNLIENIRDNHDEQVVRLMAFDLLDFVKTGIFSFGSSRNSFRKW